MENLELKKLGEVCDWINVMTYDYHTAVKQDAQYEYVTNFNAPTFSHPNDPSGKDTNAKFNLVSTMKTYLEAGIPGSKLNVGLPFYGRGFGGVEPGPNHDGLF